MRSKTMETFTVLKVSVTFFARSSKKFQLGFQFHDHFEFECQGFEQCPAP
jgi:hypothetical protein